MVESGGGVVAIEVQVPRRKIRISTTPVDAAEAAISQRAIVVVAIAACREC